MPRPIKNSIIILRNFDNSLYTKSRKTRGIKKILTEIKANYDGKNPTKHINYVDESRFGTKSKTDLD